MDTVKEE